MSLYGIGPSLRGTFCYIVAGPTALIENLPEIVRANVRYSSLL